MLDFEPMLTLTGVLTLFQMLASVASLDSAVLAMTVGGDALSSTNCALTCFGDGSGTAIGSSPSSSLAWKMETRACALMTGMSPTGIGPLSPTSLALTSMTFDVHGSCTGVSSVLPPPPG